MLVLEWRKGELRKHTELLFGELNPHCHLETVCIPNGSLLQAAGISGRTKLQEYASIDILSSFIIRVTKETQPLTAVRLEAIISKCVCVEQISSENKFVIKIPNNFECH